VAAAAAAATGEEKEETVAYVFLPRIGFAALDQR
jgi:hypothetical protein